MVIWDGPLGTAGRFLLQFDPGYGIISENAARRQMYGDVEKEALPWNMIAHS